MSKVRVFGPAVAAFESEVRAEEEGSPWGDDNDWRWLVPIPLVPVVDTPPVDPPTLVPQRDPHDAAPVEIIDEPTRIAPAAPVAHPRLIRRARTSTSAPPTNRVSPRAIAELADACKSDPTPRNARMMPIQIPGRPPTNGR